MQHFDIAIIGGGLAGASLARALAGSGLRTVVIDQQPASALYSAALDNRGLALSASSVQILTALNVWPQLLPQAYPIKTVHVSEQHSFGFTKLTATTAKLPQLGYVISASALGAALMQGLENLADLSVLRPVLINNLAYNNIDTTWTVTLSTQTISAKLLIAADGTDSMVRQQLNIPVISKDFQQSALVTNVVAEDLVQDIAYERFTAQGVIALLPFGKHTLKCVWTLDNSLVAEFKQLSDQEFLSRLQAAIGFRLGKLVNVESRQIFAIQQLQATKICDASVILVGNAANTMHPVAAQGFNLGLRDVGLLAKILIQAKQDSVAINSVAVLTEYARQREQDQHSTQKYTNTLVELFSSNALLNKISRRFGIMAAQFIPLLNKRITAQGAGQWQ